MNDYEYRSKNIKNIKVKRKLKKSVKSFINRFLITVLLFLICIIAVRENKEFKKLLADNVYNKSFKFTKAKEVYEKYFGNILSVDKVVPEEKEVFNEKISYKKGSIYKDGVKLSVSRNYLVPTIESGIVVFMGEKDGYGSTVIIQQVNGVDVWYSNIVAKDIAMYGYIKKGTLVGEVKTDSLYMLFQKEGKYLNYKEFI